MNMRKVGLAMIILLLGSSLALAEKAVDATFHGYIDSDVCAHVMLGPVTDQRMECSKDTVKKGSDPVVVRGTDNWVFEVKNQKTVKKIVGGFANVSGQTKEREGTIKISSAEAVQRSAIPASEIDAELMDVRHYRSSGDRVYEQVRHTLAMMPYISEFDYITFAMAGDHVILTGWTVRLTNRKNAYRRVQKIEGVGKITNNIEVLPMGSMDMQVRASARARIAQYLSRYFWGSGSDIKIVVKRGNIILLGNVASKGDKDLANIQANQVPGAFHVFNLLRVTPPQKGG
jgi:osmotically-inducible protein OsmY